MKACDSATKKCLPELVTPIFFQEKKKKPNPPTKVQFSHLECGNIVSAFKTAEWRPVLTVGKLENTL